MMATRDILSRWAQVSSWRGVRRLKLTGPAGGNSYHAEAAGDEPAPEPACIVVNVGEPPSPGGTLPAGTEVLALEVDGQWLIFATPAAAGATFLARVSGSLGGANYQIIEQIPSGTGYADRPGATAVAAHNLAEINDGLAVTVPVGTLVTAQSCQSAEVPPTVRFSFHYQPYAKYL